MQYWTRTPEGRTSICCSGLANRTPAREVSEATTFHCFSTTKIVTALAILQLAADGRVSLDDPVTRFLPDIPYRNGATVRQVLSHQGGLPSPLPLSWVHADADHARFDTIAFLDRILRDHPRSKPAGERVRYSNIGFLLLGRVVEIVTKRSYTDYVRERILDVVGDASDDTAFLGFDIPAQRHATGYTRRWSGLGLFVSLLRDRAHIRERERGWIRYRPFHLDGAPYGGLKGNVRGWAPLLSAIVGRDARLLPEAQFEAFFAPQRLASGRATGHALAWFTGRVAGHEYLCHAGGGPGYGSEIRVYPRLRAASAIVTNTTIVSDMRWLDRLDATWLPSV